MRQRADEMAAPISAIDLSRQAGRVESIVQPTRMVSVTAPADCALPGGGCRAEAPAPISAIDGCPRLSHRACRVESIYCPADGHRAGGRAGRRWPPVMLESWAGAETAESASMCGPSDSVRSEKIS